MGTKYLTFSKTVTLHHFSGCISRWARKRISSVVRSKSPFLQRYFYTSYIGVGIYSTQGLASKLLRRRKILPRAQISAQLLTMFDMPDGCGQTFGTFLRCETLSPRKIIDPRPCSSMDYQLLQDIYAELMQKGWTTPDNKHYSSITSFSTEMCISTPYSRIIPRTVPTTPALTHEHFDHSFSLHQS